MGAVGRGAGTSKQGAGIGVYIGVAFVKLRKGSYEIVYSVRGGRYTVTLLETQIPGNLVACYILYTRAGYVHRTDLLVLAWSVRYNIIPEICFVFFLFSLDNLILVLPLGM